MCGDQISWHHVHHRTISNGIVKEAEDASLIGGGFRGGSYSPQLQAFQGKAPALPALVRERKSGFGCSPKNATDD
jgi:hypothetical protein